MIGGGVYVAGPMRGYPGFNFAAFEKAQALVEAQFPGAKIFNPALADIERHGLEDLALTEGWEAAGKHLMSLVVFNLRAALAEDTEFICNEADHLVLLPGWEESSGARAEKALSEALNHSVWYLLPAEGLIVPTDPAAASVVHLPGDGGNLGRWERGETRTAKAMISKGDVVFGGQFETDGEVRMVSETGGAKGVKPEQYQSLPVKALRELAEHYAKGAQKYGDHNFRRGYEWSKSYSALLRHLLAFWGGEDLDPETGSKHVTAVAWHALALSTFMDEYPDYDDRYRPGFFEDYQAEMEES